MSYEESAGQSLPLFEPGAAGVAVRTPRYSRAQYLERRSARILRIAESASRNNPRESMRELREFVGELLIELRRAEDACVASQRELAALQRRHADLLDHVPVSCIVTDEFGTIVDANRNALLLLRASPRHLPGTPILLWFESREAGSWLVEQLRDPFAPVHRDVKFRPRDRRPVPGSVVVQRVEGVDPQLWRWFLLVSDAGISVENSRAK